MKKRESLNEMVERRNARLLSLFTHNNMNVRLVGDPQKPAVIYNEEQVLSCYVKNFDLIFTREPFSEEIIRTIKLKSMPEVTRRELEELIEICTHRPVYKVKLKNCGLYLVGYNYLNSHDGVGRYPVFARHKPKVYFEQAYATKVIAGLVSEGYEVQEG